MKKLNVLFFIVIIVFVFHLHIAALANDAAILACEVISNGSHTKITTGKPDFRVTVVSFSVGGDKLLTEQDGILSSCVEVLARLVNKESFKIQSVSSTENGPTYTLLLKERVKE